MTAEGNLHNPALFDAEAAPAVVWDIADEYLDLVDQWPCPISYVRGHLFKVLHHLLAQADSTDERDLIATGQSMEQFRQAVQQLRTKYAKMHAGEQPYVLSAATAVADDTEPPAQSYNLSLPPWLCQPYVRLEPAEHRRHLAEKEAQAEDPLRQRAIFLDDEGNQISRKLAKKLKRVQRRPNYQGRLRRIQPLDLCNSEVKCGNPFGLQCDHKLCRLCCKKRCYSEKMRCVGHKFWFAKPTVDIVDGRPMESTVDGMTIDV